MKVAVFGFGNQTYYREIMKVENLLGGKPPFGGSRMAIEFAQAGYETVLADPRIDTINPEFTQKVKDSGVTLTKDDIEAAKDAQIAIMFTPFRNNKTIEIANKIIPYLGENCVIATTCTMPILVLETAVKNTLFIEGREDIGFSTFHPAAVPGTPKHTHYFIGTNELLEEQIVTQEQIEKLKKLAEDTGKKAFLIPAELVSAIGDMGVATTAAAVIGALEYYAVSKDILKTTKEMTEFQIVQSLQVTASIIAKYGLEGLVKLIDLEALNISLESMLFDEKLQKVGFAAKESLKEIEILEKDLTELAKKADTSEKTFLSPPSPMLIEYIEELAGEDVTRGIVREAIKKLYLGEK